MNLVILRHGKAEDDHAAGDFSRALLKKGRLQARCAAKLLKVNRMLPDIVLTSPLIRARQTADEFCQSAGIPEALIQTWLACGMTPEIAMSELSAFRDFKCIAIVGHEPDFSKLVESILGAMSGSIEFKKGAIACLTVNPPSPHGTLAYLIPPKLTEGANT